MRFVDEAWIVVRSGKGGRGAVSFRREKFIPRGGPDGGDGGKGGDVVFRADPDLLTLYDLRLRRIYEAKGGDGGKGRQKHGKAAEDLIIDVPVGTELYELPALGTETYGRPEAAELAEAEHLSGARESDAVEEWEAAEAYAEAEELGEAENLDDAETPDGLPAPSEPEGFGEAVEEAGDPELLVDLTEPGQTYVACKGGRGGKGNLHFASSTMRTPRFAQPGESGEERRIRLVLKVLADVGIIGLPNAGKSTFIAAVSRARPKIAAYPFTTLTPNLGVIEDDYGTRLVLADIPGLIEGAHLGHGLGHRFLRHVERTRVLLHVVSAEDASPEGVFEAFGVVDEELRRFDPALAERPQIRVVNKIDLLTPEDLAERQAAVAATGQTVLFMSAKTGQGVDAVLEALWQAAAPARPGQSAPAPVAE
ncbi:GTPase obg [Solidesulfovibrio carbinoliphilus subsp. oakridgensis]|uniref:GTPase Obg n=1 Tax=Solidesulfovibrio carbinoliphilus subsp. oakridgensis TaxID=694327 RepID=G7Q8I7_9BACT|nr:GTPase ObgE [Solidesulfovibrio carbinoliphilus]EHJ48599.1 GTPase obg [Solidesulfovibrio carbinoliphilus subsp. oakridgensis]